MVDYEPGKYFLGGGEQALDGLTEIKVGKIERIFIQGRRANNDLHQFLQQIATFQC